MYSVYIVYVFIHHMRLKQKAPTPQGEDLLLSRILPLNLSLQWRLPRLYSRVVGLDHSDQGLLNRVQRLLRLVQSGLDTPPLSTAFVTLPATSTARSSVWFETIVRPRP